VRDGRERDLSAAIRKYASMDGVAFVYVEDREGKIIAHFPKDMPIYLDRDFPRSTEAALRGVTIRHRGAAVYETAKRIDGGNAGFVHLGLYSGAIEAESRRAFAPIAALLVSLLIGSAAVFIAVIRAVNRPLCDLARQADQISKGDFAVPLPLKRIDEIGEIARSLERLRSSLRAVVSRLDRPEEVRQQSKR
jgi:HAMP domain-containing protein